MRVINALVLAFAVAPCACAPVISGSADNITRLETARRSDPASESVERSLGIAYFKANRYSDARGVLQDAVAKDPKDGVAALYLGLTAESQNDYDAARVAYESYLRVGRTERVKSQVDDRLQALKLKQIQLSAKAELAKEQQLASTPGPANTIAVMPFTFTGADTSLKPLERGFAELVTTDLSRSSQLTVVERERLQALLDEMALQRSAGTQAGTGVRAGRILQVRKMVGGSIQQQGERLRASAIVTDVTSTSIGRPTTDQETIDQLFTIEKNVVFGLFNMLGVQLTTVERNAIEQRPTRSLQAFLDYSGGLELEDQGRFDDASRLFDDAVRIDPGFSAAQQKSRETKNAAAGARVSVSSMESSLRGTSEGAAVAAVTQGESSVNTVMNTALGTADGLNPSSAGAASSGGGSPIQQPGKQLSSGTGGDNPGTKTGKVTIVISQPGRP